MKIFSWIRNKRTGKDGATKPNPDFMTYHMMHRPNSNEDFSDWPNGLFSVGTFGNSDTQGGLACGQDHHEKTTPAGFKKVDQQFMRLMLSKQISLDSSFPGGSEKHNLSVEKFLDCLRKPEKETDDGDDDDDDDDDESKSNSQRNTSIVQRGSGKDIRSDKKKSGISAKSLSFVFRRVLLCRGGFAPMAPILKDSLLDAKLDSSRMEKILRAMLHKNIYPQRPSPNTTSRKYLNTPETESEEEANGEANHKSKWVKTDSEYIVLEI